ncbi:OmpA family protein [Aquipuribacter sp. MA13-6]|uniref:OmpA family protein n=1 Tax=Aquipuribacter sp. MA13-6 TaxID=3440839 RepID=UPI003EE9C498
MRSLRQGLGVLVTCPLLLLGAAGHASAGATSPPDDGASEPAAASPAGSSPRTQTSSEGVEVTTYGTVTVAPDMRSDEAPAYQALHAVQRLAEHTVVYWSVGWPEEPDNTLMSVLGRNPTSGSRLDGVNSAQFVNIALPEQGLFLYAVQDPQESRTRAATSGSDALPSEPGVMNVMYAVLPALPPDVDTVDVTLGYAGVVTDVPVGDGLLEPTVDGPEVPLGTGWPEVPDALLQPVQLPGFSNRPLFAPSEQVDGFSREAESGEQVSIDIAADVLFAFDSAELSDEAVTRLDEVAADLAERAAPGALTIVGHTDSNGSDAYNDDLSLRRAQAVADVLGPSLTDADLDISVEGRGESEPVADNGTEEGQQLNRRVTVGFTENPGSD